MTHCVDQPAALDATGLRVGPPLARIGKIVCIGLNYKDPMKILGVLGEAELAGTYFGMSFGMEGLGIITRIGAGVSGFGFWRMRSGIPILPTSWSTKP